MKEPTWVSDAGGEQLADGSEEEIVEIRQRWI
jgi:hypothetical protein